ncbi:hypothetical protein TcYC6_0019840 [Trypanosoma cruzi]|nr:hypothetical protein TcYC6_0019840 [Trypanosoma cruzi]
MKRIWVSFNLTSSLGSREVGMEACLESYSKSGALAITGKKGNAHAQIAFDILVSWMCALQLYREPNKQFMELGRIIPRVFWMQIMIKSDPSVPTQKAACPPSHGFS